jgi:hypothetical protein
MYCVSFYLKTAVVGGNDNSLDLTVEEVEIAKTMLNKKLQITRLNLYWRSILIRRALLFRATNWSAYETL